MKAIGLSLLLAVALVSHVVFAQEEAPPRLVLEVSQSGMAQPYMPVPEHGESRAFLFARSLFAPRQNSFDESRASALALVFRREQDTVKITASAYFGWFDIKNSMALQGLRQEPVGSFSLRLGDSAALQETDNFGFGPVTIRVVSATADQAFHPQVVSKVPSLQVDLVSRNRAGYDVAIRNTSSRAVIGYAASRSLTSESGSSLLSGSTRPLLAPGAIRTESEFCPPTGSGTASQPCDFVLQAALFDDGTYEGDSKHAAVMKARILATDFQQRRVQELIDNAVRDTTLDNAGRITVLRERLQALPDAPDKATEQAILKPLQAEFPSLLQDCAGPGFSPAASSAFRRIKESVLRSLDEYPKYLESRKSLSAKSLQAESPTIPLSEWLARRMTMPTTR